MFNSFFKVPVEIPLKQTIFPEDTEEFLLAHGGTVKKLLTTGSQQMNTTQILQSKRCPAAPDRTYKSEYARAFMVKIADCGLGELKTGPSKKSLSLKIAKRRGDALQSPVKRFLNKNKLLTDD